MRLTLILMAGFFASACVAAEEEPLNATHGDLVYAEVDGSPLRLDLYLPDNTERPPLVVWIHGGGWRGGSKEKPAIREVVRHGYALASIQYRFTDVAIFPAQIHDCKAAIRWLRAHADQYGYRTRPVCCCGRLRGWPSRVDARSLCGRKAAGRTHRRAL